MTIDELIDLTKKNVKAYYREANEYASKNLNINKSLKSFDKLLQKYKFKQSDQIDKEFYKSNPYWYPNTKRTVDFTIDDIVTLENISKGFNTSIFEKKSYLFDVATAKKTPFSFHYSSYRKPVFFKGQKLHIYGKVFAHIIPGDEYIYTDDKLTSVTFFVSEATPNSIKCTPQ